MNESFETLKPTEDVSCMGLGQVETKTLFFRTILDKILQTVSQKWAKYNLGQNISWLFAF